MNNNYDYNNYNDYNSKEEANNENKSEDISLYNDGEDKKPKLVIIIASIIGALILILIFAFACTKLNKKSSNNYLSNLSVTNAELKPKFDKMTLEYNVITTEDTVAIKCSAEHKKAYTSGCDKRIYLQDECVEHTVSVTSQTKQIRKYELKICKQAKDAPIIKEVKKTPTTFTSSSVKVEVIAESKNKLHEEAYSFDGGMTYQKENYIEVSENKSLEIKVRDEKNNESALLNEEIQNIDTTKPTVLIEGSTKSGEETRSNVLLTAVVNPDTTPSGYKYQWYKGSSKIKNATGITYNATSSGKYKIEVTTGSNNKATSEVYTVNIKTSGTSKPSGGGTNKKPSGGGTNKKPSVNNNKVPPVVKVSGNPTKWTAENVTLKISATAVNGLHSTAYSFDGGKTYQKENQKTFTSNTKGTIIVRDKRGNKTTYNFNILKIDKTVPKASIEGNTTLGSTLKVVVSPTTTSSGYKYQWYKSDTAISGATKNTYTPTSTGTYKVKVTTGAGNMVVSKTVNIVPAVKPTITLTGSVGSGTWTNKSVTLTAKVNNGTATKYVWYRGTSQISSGTSNTYSASVSGTYKVVATTSSGKITSSSYKVNIDTVIPKVTILATLGGYDGSSYTGNSWTNKSVYITVSAYDESGIASITSGKSLEKNINGQTATARTHYDSDGLYTFTVTVTDKVGNKVTRTQNVKIDKTAPYTPYIDSNKMYKIDKSESGCNFEGGNFEDSVGFSYLTNSKHVYCLVSVYPGENLNLGINTKDNNNGSGINYCEIVWKPYSGGSPYGDYNGFSWVPDENMKIVRKGDYNSIKWFDDRKANMNADKIVLYTKRCYDKAGNVSPSFTEMATNYSNNDKEAARKALEWIFSGW